MFWIKVEGGRRELGGSVDTSSCTNGVAGRRTPGNLDFCRPDLMSFAFPRNGDFVGMDDTTTGVVCCSILEGNLLRVVGATVGFIAVLAISFAISPLASFNLLIASCRFLNRSLLNNVSPVVLVVVLTGNLVLLVVLTCNFFSLVVLTGTSISLVSGLLELDSTFVLLFRELLVLGGGRIRLVLEDFGNWGFFSRELDDGTFFRFCFLSFFFGRRGGGVGMKDPEPANFSSCS